MWQGSRGVGVDTIVMGCGLRVVPSVHHIVLVPVVLHVPGPPREFLLVLCEGFVAVDCVPVVP